MVIPNQESAIPQIRSYFVSTLTAYTYYLILALIKIVLYGAIIGFGPILFNQ